MVKIRTYERLVRSGDAEQLQNRIVFCSPSTTNGIASQWEAIRKV